MDEQPCILFLLSTFCYWLILYWLILNSILVPITL